MPETPNPIRPLPVRFADWGNHVLIEDLDDGCQPLHDCADLTEAYRLAQVRGYNVRYTIQTRPASPLVVLR